MPVDDSSNEISVSSTNTSSATTSNATEPAAAEQPASTVQDSVAEEPVSTDAVASTNAASIPRTVTAPVVVGIVNGRITYVSDGGPAGGVTVELLASDEAGNVVGSVASSFTDDDGRYGFEAEDGCYIVVFTAPEGFSFPGIGVVLTGPSVCVSQDSPFTLGTSLEAV